MGVNTDISKCMSMSLNQQATHDRVVY